MTTAKRSVPVYETTLYHDSEGEAADKDRHLGYFYSLSGAVGVINLAKDPANGWYTGGIRYGFLHPAVLGRSPERFEPDDREDPWFVGTDGKADR